MSAPHRPMSITEFNSAHPVSAAHLLGACLDVPLWISRMLDGRPYSDLAALLARADEKSAEIGWPQVAAALDRHPRIGGRQAAGPTSAGEAAWSTGEQSGVAASDADDLAAGNAAYEVRFGYIFLICASGLSGQQMLHALRERLTHTPEQERPVVIEELRKIAALRLAKAVTG